MAGTTSAGGIASALTGMQLAVIAAINDEPEVIATNPPGQVGIGYPFGITMAQVMQSVAPPPAGKYAWLASVRPYGKSRDGTRYRPLWIPTAATLPATFDAAFGNSPDVTFSGAPMSGANVTVFYEAIAGGLTEPAIYLTQPGDDLDAIAAGAAAAVNSFSTPGITASSVGPVLTIDGTNYISVNIGTTGMAGIEVGRREQDLIVSLWCANPDLRDILERAVESHIGTAISRFIQLPDLTQMEVWYANLWREERSQSSYSLYESHFVFACEYAIVLTQPATAIEAPAVTPTLDGESLPSLYGDGR
jgi:hypothetical protein